MTVARAPADPFDAVKAVGLALPGVEAAIRYDGSPVLKVGGAFMAGLATHPSAEPETLVVRSEVEERRWLLEDAPDTYYLTEYYEAIRWFWRDCRVSIARRCATCWPCRGGSRFASAARGA